MTTWSSGSWRTANSPSMKLSPSSPRRLYPHVWIYLMLSHIFVRGVFIPDLWTNMQFWYIVIPFTPQDDVYQYALVSSVFLSTALEMASGVWCFRVIRRISERPLPNWQGICTWFFGRLWQTCASCSGSQTFPFGAFLLFANLDLEIFNRDSGYSLSSF